METAVQLARTGVHACAEALGRMARGQSSRVNFCSEQRSHLLLQFAGCSSIPSIAPLERRTHPDLQAAAPLPQSPWRWVLRCSMSAFSVWVCFFFCCCVALPHHVAKAAVELQH